MRYQVTVKTAAMNTTVFTGETTKDVNSFKVQNAINTKMNLKYGPGIYVEFKPILKLLK